MTQTLLPIERSSTPEFKVRGLETAKSGRHVSRGEFVVVVHTTEEEIEVLDADDRIAVQQAVNSIAAGKVASRDAMRKTLGI